MHTIPECISAAWWVSSSNKQAKYSSLCCRFYIIVEEKTVPQDIFIVELVNILMYLGIFVDDVS